MTRIIEMLFMYYVAIHIFSWSLICLAYNESDIRTTWLKRLPVPQPTGVRQYADRTGLSDVSIYCHAFNFAVNTLSHVATGEVSMITYQERIYWAFIILFSTFMYAFLFGNIASIVSELASQKMYFKFHKRYESVMSSLKVDVVPKRIILSIKDYFDFIWLSTHGVPINELSSKLPSWINIDILAARYSKAIQNWVLFKNASNEIDLPFTNSFLTFLNFRVYMDGDFIVIGGSHSRNTYIMMEGEAGVFSFRDEFISLMKTGSYYSNDLDSDDEDTFQYKRPVHIVSKGTSIVGVLTIEMLNELYLAYPEFKCIMRSLNRHFNLYAKKFLMKYLKSMNIIHSKSSLINQMIEHFSYSTSEKYDNIRNKLNTIDFTEREISKYDIKIKQMNRTEIIERNLTLHDHRRENNLENEYEPKAQEINQNCLSWLQFSKHSTFIQIFDAIHLFNLLYIVTSIPLMIGFNIKMTTSFFVLEIVSILISLITIIINFRVQVIKRYGPTINLKDVLIYYFNNGLIFDLFGLWPLNLVLGIPNFTQPFWLIFPLRIIRWIWWIRIYSIIRKFEISYQRYGLLINILKACLFVCIAWHFIACSWSFVNIYMERGNKTWIEYQELDNSPLYKQILYWYFNILNTVTTIGYTNFAPVTDIERIFIALTINSGDAIFAVGFGLLAGIVTQSSIYGRSEVFFSKMNSIKELLKERNCDEAQIKKVEQYFAFLWYSQNKSSDIMIIKELSEQLPHKLSKEVVYHWTKELLEPMFKKFGSENLIKDLSAVLKQTIYLPGDFIILKGDIGEEMYFIVEGTINILAADKRTVLNTLVKGSYFGEMAIFLDSNKRTAYVQAESFCNILILYKKDVDIIKEDYPSVAEDIKKETRKRYFETHNIEEDNDIVIRESDVSHSQINRYKYFKLNLFYFYFVSMKLAFLKYIMIRKIRKTF